MATEIGRLIATFEADISKFEAGRKQVESGMKSTARSVNQSQKQITDGELKAAQERQLAIYKQRQALNALVNDYKKQERAARQAATGAKPFSQVLGELSTSVAALQGPLGGISGRLSSLSSLFAGVTNPIGLTVTALGSLAAGAIAAAAAIYSLSKSTAEATGHFKDLAQQTGFSVETLSTLANLAETSGGNIDTVSAALSLFQSNMVEAQDPTTEMSRLFKQLGIDTKDNEKALRQFFEALRRETNEENQSAIARKLAGRSARELLAISKEMPGTFDEATKSMRGSTLITTQMAEKGDELSDAITRMTQVFNHATNVVGQEFGPDVKRAVESVTKAIIDNKEMIHLWASAFADATRNIYNTVSAIAALISHLRTLDGIPIMPVLSAVLGIRVGGKPAMSPQDQLLSQAINMKPAETPWYMKPNWSRFRPDQLGAPKKAGGGAGKRSAADEPSTVSGWTKALETLQRVNDQLMDEVRKFDEQMEHVTKSVTDAMVEQGLTILALEAHTPDWVQRAEEFIRAKTDEGYVWEAETKQIYLNNAARLEQQRIIAQGATRPRRATEVGGAGGLGGALAGSEEIIRKQYEQHVERMRDLAMNLTGILDRAIFDGFQGGLKRGFQSLTLGILDLVRNVFLKQLENALTNALAGIGGGGGSFWGGLFKSVLGSVAGGFGGGGGGSVGGLGGAFAGKFASGGNIPMGQWGIVHDNERVIATPFGAQVIPSSGGGSQAVNNYNINVQVRGGGSYSSRKSQRQLAEDVSAALRGSLA